jgi:hypothetical protein
LNEKVRNLELANLANGERLQALDKKAKYYETLYEKLKGNEA